VPAKVFYRKAGGQVHAFRPHRHALFGPATEKNSPGLSQPHPAPYGKKEQMTLSRRSDASQPFG
jgi:hypothetical protein